MTMMKWSNPRNKKRKGDRENENILDLFLITEKDWPRRPWGVKKQQQPNSSTIQKANAREYQKPYQFPVFFTGHNTLAKVDRTVHH